MGGRSGGGQQTQAAPAQNAVSVARPAPYVEAYLPGFLERADELSQLPYNPYPGQTVAGLNDFHNTALNAGGQYLVNQLPTALNQAMNIAGGGWSSTNPFARPGPAVGKGAPPVPGSGLPPAPAPGAPSLTAPTVPPAITTVAPQQPTAKAFVPTSSRGGAASTKKAAEENLSIKHGYGDRGFYDPAGDAKRASDLLWKNFLGVDYGTPGNGPGIYNVSGIGAMYADPTRPPSEDEMYRMFMQQDRAGGPQ